MMNNHHPHHAATFMLRLLTIQLVAAQLLSAYDQAYGQWKIKLSRNVFGEKWYIETVDPQRGAGKQKQDAAKGSALQLMFPNNPIIRQDYLDDNEDDEQQENATPTTVSLTHKPVRSINCLLNLQRNGRFTIHLDDNHHDNVDETTKCKNNYQPLHGEWFLTPNPYCVTDRHYDEITLISQPRIRRVYLPSSTVVEKATVELRCRLWGRYSAGAVRRKLGWEHGRSRSRMTHGNVLTVKETFHDNGGGSLGEATQVLPQRDVVGAFCGKAVDLGYDGGRSEIIDVHGTEEDDLDPIFDYEDDAIGAY